VLVRVSVSDFGVPTWTLPNATLVGFGTRSPGAVPVAESGMLRLASDPVEVMLTLPVTAPLAAGLKVTVNDVLCPAERVRGSARPLKLNPVPVAAAALI